MKTTRVDTTVTATESKPDTVSQNPLAQQAMDALTEQLPNMVALQQSYAISEAIRAIAQLAGASIYIPSLGAIGSGCQAGPSSR